MSEALHPVYPTMNKTPQPVQSAPHKRKAAHPGFIPTMTMGNPGVVNPFYLPPASLDVFSAFSAKKWKGELAEAQRNSMLKRIVKKKIAEEDGTHIKYHNADGKPLEVTPFPFLAGTEKLRDYACPVAVNLYLTFMKECALLFFLMFLLAVPELIINTGNSAARDACRAVTHTPAEYDAITGTPHCLRVRTGDARGAADNGPATDEEGRGAHNGQGARHVPHDGVARAAAGQQRRQRPVPVAQRLSQRWAARSGECVGRA